MNLESPHGVIVAGDAENLTIRSGNNQCSELRWSNIEEVHAYKVDLFTTDLICLSFKQFDDPEYYEIHEEMAGYRELLKLLPSCLPGFSLEWFPAVAFPAFQANHLVIWRKSSELA
jgi:hypothetical protein